LEPVLERVFLSKNKKLASQWRLPLKPLTVEAENLFPATADELGIPEHSGAQGEFSDPGAWNHLVAESDLCLEYKDLCKGLMTEIETLACANPGISLPDLVQTMFWLVEKYTVNVPAATNIRHPDISLFDHLRTTAAIAQSLYLQQVVQEKPTIEIENKNDSKWLLVCGDFSGIQKFIYNLTNKGAAKGLRGRSFYVQFFCSECARYFCRRLKITEASILYNSGGKFYLLLPSRYMDDVYCIREEVNTWLLEEFGGSVFLGLGGCPVTGNMFDKGEMHGAWGEVNRDLELDRTVKFRGQMSKAFFEPMTGFDPTKSCPVCGSRTQFTGDKCQQCERLEKIGLYIRDAGAILTVRGEDKLVEKIQKQLNLKQDSEFSLFGTHSLFIPEDRLENLDSLAPFSGRCIYLNANSESELSKQRIPQCALQGTYVGKWVRGLQEDEENHDWDFERFADAAKGIKRMGILRMDVDNLGTVFVEGLRFPEREKVQGASGWGDVTRKNDGTVKRYPMASISRIVTLSRQLQHFFSGYVPSLLRNREFNRCQIVYAGGDDLFVIGSWDQLPHLAHRISHDFSRFCCHNPDITISGGMIMQRGKYPIYKGAALAGEAESRAKNVRRRWKKWITTYNDLEVEDFEKNGFCFQGTPILWEDMDACMKIKAWLEDESTNSKGLASYLARATARNTNSIRKKLLSGTELDQAWEGVLYEAWRWQTAYQLRRRYNKDSAKREFWADALFGNVVEISKLEEKRRTLLPVVAWLGFPLRWTDYLSR
jgi:CRISPR-associated protein Csm1